jgi:hypothetical protein
MHLPVYLSIYLSISECVTRPGLQVQAESLADKLAMNEELYEVPHTHPHPACLSRSRQCEPLRLCACAPVCIDR